MALYNMKEILLDAQKRAYGVGYFNAVNLEMIRAYIEAAEELDSPIIIGTAEALLPICLLYTSVFERCFLLFCDGVMVWGWSRNRRSRCTLPLTLSHTMPAWNASNVI